MNRMLSLGLAALCAATLVAGTSRAGLLSSADAIIAIDVDAPSSASNFPGGENPPKAFDGMANTKYLNFGGNVARDIGIIISPALGSTTVQSMQFTTAGDAVERDPATWKLFGTNDPITTPDNGSTPLEAWTLIAQGAGLLPDTRQTAGPVYSFANATAYSSYQILIPEVKTVGAANSMQIAEIGLFASSDGSGASVLSAVDPVILGFQLPISRAKTPVNEAVEKLIDGMPDTKYLNFSKENSGFIVTPAGGALQVGAFQITTANDADARDPATWELYGTVDPITSAPFSDGSSEDWTLIAAGATNLPTDRGALGPLTSFTNGIAYTSYRMVFPTLRNSGGANSMQIAEVQFFVPEPGSLGLALAGAIALCGLRRQR